MKKHFLPFLAIAAVFAIISCKKSGNSPSPVTIAGKWTIVSDSTWSNGYPAATGAMYHGTPADYFNFNVNGVFSFSESRFSQDALGWEVAGDTLKMSNTNPPDFRKGVANIFMINSLTQHKLTITTIPSLIPPGYDNEIIVFSR